MSNLANQLIFSTTPLVTIATNRFFNVPVIVKFDDVNLIEIVRNEDLGFTTQIPIYHSDGTFLAKVNGTRMYLSDDGKKAGLTIDKKSNVWECKLGSQTLFEIHHQQGNAFRATAELYTPKGFFVKCSESATPDVVDINGKQLNVGNISMSNCYFENTKTGIWIRSSGSVSIG